MRISDWSSDVCSSDLVFDGLDILVNNAGKTWGGPIDSFPDKAWPGVMAVNVQTPFKMVQELLPELTASGASGDPARVINIGSVAGDRIEPLQAYSYSEIGRAACRERGCQYV